MGVMKRLLGSGRGFSSGRMRAPAMGRSALGHVDFSLFLDRKVVMERIDAKTQRVLMRVGGFARTTMRNSIKHPRTGKKARTVNVNGRLLFVPRGRGKVLDAQTGAVVSTPLATRAHLVMRDRLRSEGANKPPRRGPLDLLRKHIYFAFEPESESVVIAPLVFGSQPSLIGVQNVPELLEFGGKEVFRHHVGTYAPHPYVRPVKPLAEQKMAEEIERIPL